MNLENLVELLKKTQDLNHNERLFVFRRLQHKDCYMKASIANLTYLYPDNAFKIQCCSTIIGIRKKGERQARLQNLFQNEKTSKVANPSSTCTETAGHITPLSPWRGAGGEAFLGEGLGAGGGEAGWGQAFYFITV
ncbi:hypothetical protein [Prevotella sp. oral taxon 317]|uniref:hypothetical protein n=1 Tax=Prevotella sp. oral taxon 317 TaxID=652721 RepID=UPI0012F98693|nr:hypothetical protein [Prevotella sp. oral taxon 317]